MLKRLSVIIVSYKTIDVLRACLDSIEKYNDIGEALEVIVSDNSPDMQVVEMIHCDYPWVITIKNENIGFGAGNNRGVDIATSEYLLFLNPDTVLVEPIFSFAVKNFDKDENLALFGVQLITLEGKNNASFFITDKHGIMAAVSEKIHHKIGRYKDGKMFVCGADIFVRKQSFEQAGRFDENIFMYKEEPDLIKRIKIKATAKRTTFYPKKRIVHLEGGSGTKCNHLKGIERLVDSDAYYANKWGLDFNKILRGRMRYERLKKIIYTMMFKKEKTKQQKEIIDFYKSRIKRGKD